MSDPNGIKTLIVAGGVLGILIVLTAFCSIYVLGSLGLTSTSEPSSPQQPVVQPTQQIVYVSIPSTISFTVMKTNAAQPNSVNGLDREYSVLTTNGDILVLPNYYSWDDLYPRRSYTCDVESELTDYGRKVYSVSGCKQYSYQNYYNQYYDRYYYNNNDYNPQYPNDWYHDYDRNTGKYKNWDYYHYAKHYWKCIGEMCTEISLSEIPSYITIHEENPF